jgi:hypothetical protein
MWVFNISAELLSLFGFFFLLGSAFGQSLPDAPTPVPHHRDLFALAGAVAFDLGANVYDVRETERGLKAGVAVEGNTWLVGTHPSARALYGRDLLVLGLASTPSIIFHLLHKRPLFYGGLAGPIVYGVEHIQGGNSWKRLLH